MHRFINHINYQSFKKFSQHNTEWERMTNDVKVYIVHYILSVSRRERASLSHTTKLDFFSEQQSQS